MMTTFTEFKSLWSHLSPSKSAAELAA